MNVPAGRARRPVPLFRLLLTLCSGAALGWATVPASLEAQVTPADSAAVLLQAATGFEREGRWEIAEALYQLIDERFGATPSGAVARTRLAAAPQDRLERISRVELPVFGAVYGLWLGVAVPAALGVDDEEGYGLGLLFGGPLGLFTARAASRARPWSEGQVRSVTWGGIWGTWQGFGWREVFDLGQDEYCDVYGYCWDSGDDTEEAFAGMVLGGLAGIATGAVIARGPVRSGVSSAAQTGSTWGSIYGGMLAALFDASEDKGLATSLLMGNAGLLAGMGLGRQYDLSRSRVRMINVGALVGGVAGLGIDLLIDVDDEDAAILIPLITSVGGLSVAAHATRDSSPDRSGPGDAGGLGPAPLLGIRDGALSLEMPTPVPTLLPVDDYNGRTHWRPGVRFELFRAVF